MRGLLRVLKSRTFLIGLGFMLLICLVLLLGAWLAWDWIIRLVAIIGVLVVGILILMFQFMRANRGADEIEKSIKKQAEQQRISTRPDRRGEVEELQQQFDRAIERLKQSKLGQGKRGRAALYALPWYMFIGPPGAGKTTAIVNSGLNFPIGTDRVQGVGGTRNCDWFFTDSAILLDTAGRYMTEQEDADEWLAFLDSLKQYRSERPVNGVIIGIPVPDLALASYDQVEWHADNIRRRVDELVRRLGVKFPVYLVFTKSDMLQGFVEFFGEMSRRDREQVWGATFNKDQQESTELRAVFEREFEVLTSAMVNRRSARLSRPMKREERQLVYAFPLQLASLKDNLGYFVQRLFQPNPYQENPVFRGFYFTSGTQEGVPLDRVIQTIARQFDLPGMGAVGGATAEAKSYFIKDLFTDVIVPDQYMVRRTSKASRRGNFQRVGVTVGALVLLGLFLLGASQALVRSRGSLNRAEAAAASTGSVAWDAPATAIDNLGRIDTLNQQLDRLDRTAWLRLGLSRDGTVLQPIRRLYLDHARSFVRAYPLHRLENNMRQATRDVRVEDADREALTEDLKAYLLLTEERPRLEEENNRTFLIRHLTELAVADLEPTATTLTQGELRSRVEPPVTAFVGALREQEALAFASDPNLIRTTRARIDEPPSIQSLYARLRLEGRDAVPPFRLQDAVPGRFGDLLRSDTEVPGFFTQNGWETFVADKIEEVSRNPTGEDWVMGRGAEETPLNLGTEDQVASELVGLYFSDYTSEWLRFLRGVRVKNFSDMRDAARSMGTLGDANGSPIAYLLANVTVQTRFENQSELAGDLQDQVAQGVDRAAQRAARRLGARGRIGSGLGGNNERHPVDLQFQWLHNLKADLFESGGAAPSLYQAFTGLREIGSTLDGIAGDQAQVAQYAAAVLKGGGGDLDRELRNIGSALATFNQDARRQLFEQPVMQAWSAVLGITQQHLNNRWQDVVYNPFRSRFASAYPFDPGSSADAPISDVEAFFAPESGVVNAFLQEELEPYVGRNIEQPVSWRGTGIRLSTAAREAIRRAQHIAANLYNSGRMSLSFELQPEQPDASTNAPTVYQVSLRLLGREETYDLGSRRWTRYDWPGTGDAVLTVSTQTADLTPKRYDGAWALFRMLQEAGINARTSTQYELRWSFERTGQYTITARYDLRTQSAANPFGNLRGFFNFQPPPALDQ